MGAVAIDIEKGQRKLEALYPLTTYEGVEALLNDLHKIKEEMYDRGEYSTVDLLIDFDEAVKQANLTAKQRRAVELVFFIGYTQAEAGKIMGVVQSSVQRLLVNAITNISNVYKEWVEKGWY